MTPRQPSEPTPQQILDLMTPGEPYTSTDMLELVQDAFEGEDDVADSKWTVKRRLDTLAEEGRIERKDHTKTMTTFWKPVGGDGE